MPSRAIRCPVASTLDIVGDRWTLLIVRELLKGKTRYSEFRRSIEGITTTMLSERLKLLEAEDIVTRHFYSQHPPRAEYVLTAKGHGLGVVVGALAAWGEQYSEHDLALVDNGCGHGVSVVYHCDTCGREAPRSRIRIVEV
ncbi:MAG TPA: helix-turn-helix domain-containing protein [Tepidiformaceae bacterium]